MKYIILIPIYNDRKSLKLLIENINSVVRDLNHKISLIVINDASSQQIIDTYSNIENISLHLNLTSLASANNKEDEEFLKSLTFTKLFFLRNKKKEICKKEIDHQIRKFTKHFSSLFYLIH